MAVVNIVVPPLQRCVFTGGILCIFEYARGLTARGHQVNILPLLPSPAPVWIAGYGRVLGAGAASRRDGAPSPAGTERGQLLAAIRELVGSVSVRSARFFPHEVQRGLQLRFVRQQMCPADVTLATSFETALPVHLYGTGRRHYFVQHFEPYFAIDLPDPQWAEHEARNSYCLGLNIVANSRWLAAKVAEHARVEPALCNNAVDHDVFHGEPKPPAASDEVRVISYGGRKASWKGFREMAAAMRVARRSLPHKKIRWLVYGDSLLPPNNDIAEYEPLGFLQLPALARAYRESDILLSASWYESFPLFPLEAMACGLAVVTTQPGTEEFAMHARTAEIVEPRNVESIAHGLCKVIGDTEYRYRLAVNGREIAQRFSWPRSVERMEALLLRGGERSAERDAQRPNARIGGG